MILIENKVEEIFQKSGIDGIYEIIADSSKICYQTQKLSKNSKDFVESVLLKSGHTRPLEFGTIYLKIPMGFQLEESHVERYQDNPYSKVNAFCRVKKESLITFEGYDAYITTNLRVIMQGDYQSDYEAWKNSYDKNWLDDLKYWCEPTEHHFRRRTFGMLLSRGASDDLRTHITLSSICESTRWCNYSKGKYGSQLTGIKPYWIDFKTKEPVEVKTYGDGSIDNEQIRALDFEDYQFVTSMALEEIEYMRHAEEGLQAQQLKRLFPLWGKCELRLCGFEDAWDNFMWRRMDEHADPECKKIAEMIEDLRGKK